MAINRKWMLVGWATLLAVVLVSPVAAEQPRPNESDRCPVCGMFVAPYHNWQAVVTFTDGQQFFFDGPKDLFRFVFDLKTYQPGRTLEELSLLQVTEYYSTRLTDAREVFFVTGSNVLGPMGQELVPIAGKKNAEVFLREHGGKAIMLFDGRQLNKVVASD